MAGRINVWKVFKMVIYVTFNFKRKLTWPQILKTYPEDQLRQNMIGILSKKSTTGL